MEDCAGSGGPAFGHHPPRLNDLLQGKLEKFSLDALVNLAAASGPVLEMKIAAA